MKKLYFIKIYVLTLLIHIGIGYMPLSAMQSSADTRTYVEIARMNTRKPFLPPLNRSYIDKALQADQDDQVKPTYADIARVQKMSPMGADRSVLFGQRSGFNAVSVVNLDCNLQTKDRCGWYALANVLALDACVQQGMHISSENCKTIQAQMLKRMNQKMGIYWHAFRRLYPSDIVKIAQTITPDLKQSDCLNAITIIEDYESGFSYYRDGIGSEVCSSFDTSSFLPWIAVKADGSNNPILKFANNALSIKNRNGSAVSHFVVLTPNPKHWVVVSMVVDKAGHKTIYFIDSDPLKKLMLDKKPKEYDDQSDLIRRIISQLASLEIKSKRFKKSE